MADGDTITAALFNDEFNRLLTAFSYASSSTTGHQHDGTAGEGGNVPTIGDQDFLNKIAVDSTNNRWGFYVEVSSAAVEQIRVQDGAIVPVTDNDIDLGTSSLEFKDAYFDGTVTTDALVADTADINGGSVDGATLGTNSAITQAVIDNVNINGATIGHTDDTDLITLADGVVTVAGELDATTLDISGNADIDGTLEADAITVDGTALNEYIADTVGAMVSSNTETNITVTYEDADNTLDFVIGTLNQDTTGTAAVATSITASANNSADETVYLTFVDGATGTQGIETDTGLTYNPSTGIIGATGFSATNLTGTLQSAAQTNVTSVGTLTALTVDDVGIDGKVITMTGSSSDTATFTVGTNGTLDIVTTDDSAAAANIQITADGTAELAGTTVTLDSSGGITLDADSGTITFADGGSSLGTITSSGYSGTAAVATTVVISDNENTNENNAIIFSSGGDVDGGTYGLESDGDLTYNPSTGLLSSTGVTASGTVTYGSLSDGSITITAFVDEDNMASDSATLVPTQQSVKAYVDAQVTAEDLDITTDSGTIAIDLDSETLTVAGGTGLASSASSNTVTLTVDAAQTGITSLLATDIKIGEDDQTKIDFEDADKINFYAGNEKQLILEDGALYPGSDNIIDLGKSDNEFKDAFFDGTVTADAFAGPLTGDVTGNVSGTAATVTGAAQSNITSLGTLTTLTVDNVIINGTTIGHTSDTDLMTLADGVLTVAGELDATSLDISGDADIDGTLEADAITVNGVTLAETIADTVGAMVGSNTETGISVTYEDGDNTLDFALAAAQTSITSLLATDIKIGEDDQTKIDFETADEIHFYANNVEQVYLGDNIFGPQSDSDVDLGSSSVRWKDAYVDSITVTGEVDGASLDISGDADIDGTTNLDAVDIDGAVQIDGTTNFGVNDTGVDVKFFGATAGKYMLWDESQDSLIINGGIQEAATTVTSSSNATTINLDTGTNFLHDLTENTTFTFSNPPAAAGIFTLKIIQDSSARTITWPGTVDWPSATAPTLTSSNNGVDVFVFLTIDGGTIWYGFTAGQAMG